MKRNGCFSACGVYPGINLAKPHRSMPKRAMPTKAMIHVQLHEGDRVAKEEVEENKQVNRKSGLQSS